MSSANALYDRRRKRWRVHLHDTTHEARWSVTKTHRAEAETFATDCQLRFDRGEDLRPVRLRATQPAAAQATPGTVGAFALDWLAADWDTRKGTTNAMHAHNLRDYILPGLGRRPLSDTGLSRKTCIAFVQSLRRHVSTRTKRPLKFKSRVSVQLTLSAVCAAAVDEGHLTANPAVKMTKYLRDPDEIQQEVVAWTSEEVQRFLRVVQQEAAWWYSFFYVALRTGLRLGELIELRWSQDFRHPGKLHVQRQYMIRPRKAMVRTADGGFETRAIPGASRVTTTKGKQTRLVDLRPDVQLILNTHKAAQREAAFAHGAPVPDLVFQGPRGGRVHADIIERRLMKPLVRRARIPLTTSIHALRHTYATVLLAAGEDLDYVSRQLGHAQTSTTERHYKHWILDTRRDVERGARIDRAWLVVDESEGRK